MAGFLDLNKFNNHKIMHNYVIILVLALLCQSCLVTRTASPALSGHVYDAKTKQPLEGCRITICNNKEPDAVTDKDGYYKVEQQTYREIARVGMEAPDLRAWLSIQKTGYEHRVIGIDAPYGGGMGKGAHWEVGPVYLKRDPSESLNYQPQLNP